MSFGRNAALAALIALAALPLGAQQVPERNAGRHASGRAPLAVRVLAPSPETNAPLRYVINEPAYVAAFIVYPGAGVRMIYPLSTHEERKWAGFHDEPLFGVQFDAEAYSAVLGPVMPGPRYLYVIASRTPLDVGKYVHHPSRLERDVSLSVARSFDSEDDLVALVNHVVTVGDDDSWDADVYVLWQPGANPALADEGLTYPSRILVCSTGMSLVVPFNYPFAACPGDQRLVPLPRVRRPVSQRASSEVEKPTVLPTIRGVRLSNADARKAGTPTTALTTTAAGGVTVADGESVEDQGEVVNSDGTVVLAGVPVSYGHDRGDRSHRERFDSDQHRNGNHDGDHRDGMRRGDGRDAHDDGRRGGYRDGYRVDGPVIANPNPASMPVPRLAPNPQPAPPPRLAPPPMTAPRMAAPVMHSEPVHAAPPPSPAQSTPQSHPGAPPQKVQ
jgi:hypothetical protein